MFASHILLLLGLPQFGTRLIAMKISHRVYVMGHGQIVFEGTPKELEKRDDIRKEWLEV